MKQLLSTVLMITAMLGCPLFFVWLFREYQILGLLVGVVSASVVSAKFIVYIIGRMNK